MSVATVEVNLAALTHNLSRLQRFAPASQMMAVVKANAYGHGMIAVARQLQSHVAYLGVARLSEAVALRAAGITAAIVLLEGFFPHDDLQSVVAHDLQPVIHSAEQIDRLQTLNSATPLTVWFKVDTGMHRLGFRLEEAYSQFTRLARCRSVAKPINLLSHFCCADELDNPFTIEQIEAFNQFRLTLPDDQVGLQSLAASGGVLAWPASHHTLIRPGIALYGVSPFAYSLAGQATGAQLGLQPVMTLKSELVAVRPHKKGEAASYGQIWRSERDTRLGVVAMGYGDGYPRSIPANIPVLINGQRYAIVGRVAMDMILVDLGPDSTAQAGDEVIFWGEGLPVEEIADRSGISAYELLTHLTGRARLIYINPKINQ